MKKKVLYVLIKNSGDGSAYPVFFEDKLCAEIDESLETEGFCDAISTLTINYDGEISLPKIMTAKEYLKELQEIKSFYHPIDDSVELQKILESIEKVETLCETK